MSYTVTITTALGRTIERIVDTLDEVCHTINSTHLARLVSVVDNANGTPLEQRAILALLDNEALV